ncbi:hypothetical protein ACFWFG_19760, partial [Streptomyces roseolus]
MSPVPARRKPGPPPEPLTADGPAQDEGDGLEQPAEPPQEVEVELRPQRRLRLWQLAPIVGL